MTVSILVSDAVKILRDAGCSSVEFVSDDLGSFIETKSEGHGFKRVRHFHPVDSLWSLVNRDEIEAEACYWRSASR